MHILVTGGAGFIGSHTVDALLQRGDTVRVLDSLEPPVHASGRPDYAPADVELVRGSVLDRQQFRSALRDVKAVIHLAAYQDYLTDFSRFFHVNAVGTALLYELIVNDRLPVQKVVVASSQAVYGEGKHCCPEHGVVYPGPRSETQLKHADWEPRCPNCDGRTAPLWSDEAVIQPHNSYAMSKRAQEELALTLGRRYGIASVALRYSIVQGARQSFRNAYSGALRSFTIRVLTGHRPVVYEDGQQLRDYVSIHDVVRANLLALTDERADYQAFNVGGERRVTVRELANLVIREVGQPVEPDISGLYRVGDTRHILSDISKLRSLGWAPVVQQADMVREYIAWAVEQPDLRDTVATAQVRMQASGVLCRADAVAAT
jgi:dTDP-L-rhamnose 4-epimerase